jgi:hypothetical protein
MIRRQLVLLLRVTAGQQRQFSNTTTKQACAHRGLHQQPTQHTCFFPTITKNNFMVCEYIMQHARVVVFALGARPEEVTYMGFLVIAS